MNVRLMTINDYEKVYELWLSCAGMGLNNLDDSKEGIYDSNKNKGPVNRTKNNRRNYCGK